MSEAEALAGFLAKWRARWPEWAIAQAFVPAAQREPVAAWFALLQELTDAAWGGSDPTPGLAKLAWWQEELRGWSKGAHRHPLGASLQRLAVPWEALAASLLALQLGRARPADRAAALATPRAFAAAVAHCEAALFGASGDVPAPVDRAGHAVDLVAVALLAERLLADPEAAVPAHLQERADAAMSAPRRWAAELLAGWPRAAATRPRNLRAALLRARLADTAADGDNRPLSPLRTLWLGWRAARKG